MCRKFKHESRTTENNIFIAVESLFNFGKLMYKKSLPDSETKHSFS